MRKEEIDKVGGPSPHTDVAQQPTYQFEEQWQECQIRYWQLKKQKQWKEIADQILLGGENGKKIQME